MYKRIWIIMLLVGLLFPTCRADCKTPCDGIRSFLQGFSGDWIGIATENVDGKQDEAKYFHAVMKQETVDLYISQFQFYRLDTKTGKPAQCGDMTIKTTVKPDGTCENRIRGNGCIRWNGEQKPQEHDICESLTLDPSGCVRGVGTGKIKVAGLPFDAGNGGMLKDTRTVWNMQNGVMTLDQSLKAVFKVAFFRQSVDFKARYEARRGSDVSTLMVASR